jgi:hypothetical protein
MADSRALLVRRYHRFFQRHPLLVQPAAGSDANFA